MNKKTKWKVAIYTIACIIIGNIIAYIIGSAVVPVILAGFCWALVPMAIIMLSDAFLFKVSPEIQYADRIWPLWVMVFVLGGIICSQLILIAISFFQNSLHF